MSAAPVSRYSSSFLYSTCPATELTMKMIAIVPTALLAIALIGCAQQASNAPVAARPAAAAETNTFGENKDETASNAAKARDASYGSDPAPGSGASSGSAPAPK
jgi:hypothetical protein